MNIQALLKVLEAHDLNKAAQLLEHLEQSEDKLNIIKQVFDYSHASDNDMSVDVRVLYRQIYALTSYRSAYQVILLRDFYCVLQEMLTSIGSFSSVTLEESEYQDAPHRDICIRFKKVI
ncbi:hypothetical protein ACFFIS_02320 [Virgibacillus soli]|uniref:Uncharacterized protein n=1 Tax=Paracerasibacillus soli TaxID=480284 RepID=A0ABU5CPH3_9BACI|nr:hypothetical protein [Virgibacillus soli]MDY0408253.1 hypothetical protein [Virgibacillus soli]